MEDEDFKNTEGLLYSNAVEKVDSEQIGTYVEGP